MSEACRKRGWPDQATADRKARRVAELNGHGMRAYQCRRCGQWHLTANEDHKSHKVLPWRRVSHGEFRAAWGEQEFRIQQRPATDLWFPFLPNELVAGPFQGLAECRQWCDAASFLPEGRWQELLPR